MSRRAILWVVVLSFFAAVIAGAVWHFLRPVEQVTVIVAHVRIDRALSGGTIIVDGREVGSEVWISLTGDEREGRDLSTGEIDWYAVGERMIVRDLLPAADLTATDTTAEEWHEFLMLGGARVRGIEGPATVDGTRHHWIWLVAGDPEDEHSPSGVALRAQLGAIDLVVREATGDLHDRTRETTKWQRWLLRRVVRERVVEITLAAPDRDPSSAGSAGER